MIDELTFDENGQTKTIKIGKKALKLLEKHSIPLSDVDLVVGHDELLMVWPPQYAAMIDDATHMGILRSYNHLDKHVIINNI